MNSNISLSSSLPSSNSPGTGFKKIYHINQLPADIFKIIFDFVPSSQRAKLREVCKDWSVMIEATHYPHITVYGRTAWKKYFNFEIEDEVPKPPSEIIEKVELIRSQLSGNESCSLTLIPKGLTFKKLENLIKNPNMGCSTQIAYIEDKVRHNFESKAVDKTTWVLFYEGVIEGSKEKTYDEQTSLVKKRTESQCSLPGVIDVLTCIAFKRARTGQRLFGGKQLTYIRCEMKGDDRLVVVGNFSHSGLEVASDIFKNEVVGVTACRKF